MTRFAPGMGDIIGYWRAAEPPCMPDEASIHFCRGFREEHQAFPMKGKPLLKRFPGERKDAMNSKRKGNTGERELCEVLKAAGYESAHRNEQRYIGGVDNPDISAIPGYHIECKRVEKLSLYEAFEQAEHDGAAHGECAGTIAHRRCGHAVPVVMHRRNRKPWLCVMKLEDWLKLIKA